MAIGFASDIDGTLVRLPTASVGRRDREAIERLRAAGGLFGVSTGRNRCGTTYALRRGPACDFAVLCTGALVLGEGSQVLFERCLGLDVAKEIIGRIVARSCVSLIVGDRYWTTSRLVGLAGLYAPYAYTPSLDDIDEPTYGLSLLFPTESGARRVAERIEEELADVACCHLNRTVVDVVPAGCTKATGLAIVTRELALHPVYAIGDSYNDLSMFEVADVSFTFCGSPAPVRAAATHMVSSVAAALETVSAGRA